MLCVYVFWLLAACVHSVSVATRRVCTHSHTSHGVEYVFNCRQHAHMSYTWCLKATCRRDPIPVYAIARAKETAMYHLMSLRTCTDYHDSRRCGCLCHTMHFVGDIPVTSIHVEVQRGLVKKRLLLLAGDIESNPGPCKLN